MPKFEDLVGQRHGRLVVSERIENYEGACDSRSQYLCICECGKEVRKTARDLKRGSIHQACESCYVSPSPHRNSSASVNKIPRNINGFPDRRAYLLEKTND